MHQHVQHGLNTLAKNLGVLRNHVHERHRATMDSNVAFMEWLTRYLERQAIQMSKILDSLNKVKAEKEAWKSYANGLQPQVDAANAAATTAQAAEKAAEDKLAAIPIIPDTDDVAAVDAVIAAPDDLPPAA